MAFAIILVKPMLTARRTAVLPSALAVPTRVAPLLIAPAILNAMLAEQPAAFSGAPAMALPGVQQPAITMTQQLFAVAPLRKTALQPNFVLQAAVLNVQLPVTVPARAAGVLA